MAGATIDLDTFFATLTGTSGNPMADEEVPKVLRALVERGDKVLVHLDGQQWALGLRDEKFVFTPVARVGGVVAGRSSGGGQPFSRRSK